MMIYCKKGILEGGSQFSSLGFNFYTAECPLVIVNLFIVPPAAKDITSTGYRILNTFTNETRFSEKTILEQFYEW